MKIFFIAIMSIALSVAAQFFLKTGMSSEGVKVILSQPYSIQNLFNILLEKYILSGFLLYGLGALVWLFVLSEWDVSKAYPLVGFGFVLTVFVGYFIGEEITHTRMLGVALICIGVFLVGRS